MTVTTDSTSVLYCCDTIICSPYLEGFESLVRSGDGDCCYDILLNCSCVCIDLCPAPHTTANTQWESWSELGGHTPHSHNGQILGWFVKLLIKLPSFPQICFISNFNSRCSKVNMWPPKFPVWTGIQHTSYNDVTRLQLIQSSINVQGSNHHLLSSWIR